MLTKLRERTLFLLCLLILAGGCKTTTTTAPSGTATPGLIPITLQSGAIEPGVGIKEVKLGQTRAEVEHTLGSPSEQDANEFVKGQTYLLFHSKGIELTLQDDVVQVITLHVEHDKWASYSGGTKEGLGVTSTWQEVEAAFGKPPEEAAQALTYPSQGLKFRFDQKMDGDATQPRVENVSLVPPVAAK